MLALRCLRAPGIRLASLRAASTHSTAAGGWPGGPTGTPSEERAWADAFLASFVNHEKNGVPAGAGADGPLGFPLERMHALLEALGSPHRAFPVVHVAGSKGKGSTAALVASVLRCAGYRVCVYSSPHAAHVRERFGSGRDGGPPSPAAFARLVRLHAAAVQRVHVASPLTHFEVTTALALAHFAATRPDVAVVETGLGGTRDATNVFEQGNLEAAVVTALDLEHLAALGGKSIDHVAAAKAGILRQGRPAVLGPQPLAGAMAALTSAAASRGVDITDTAHVRVDAADTEDTEDDVLLGHRRVSFAVSGEGAFAGTASMRLLGDHQRRNAQAALAVLQAMRLGPPSAARLRTAPDAPAWRITPDAVAEGLSQATLRGRFEVLRAPTGSAGPILVVDGAHTPAAARALAATLRECGYGDAGGRRLAIVLAMAADKDAFGVCEPLSALRPVACFFTRTRVAGASTRAAAPEWLAETWWREAPSGAYWRAEREVQPRFATALACAVRAAGPHGTVCVAGSLHAAWEAGRLARLAGGRKVWGRE